MTCQHTRHRLAHDEPAPDQPGETQDHGEQPDDLHLIGRVGETDAELCEVDLGLLAGGRLEAHGIGLASTSWSQRAHHVAHRAVTTGIATFAKLTR